MILINVQRSPADTPGPDIASPLLTSELAARERGRVEIDHESTNRLMVAASGPCRGWVAPGSLVEYHGRRGTWRGLVIRCGITISRSEGGITAERHLEIEREANP